MKSAIVLGLIFGWSLAYSRQAPEPVQTNTPGLFQLSPAYINGLAEEMRTNNPGILAADARARAAAANVGSIRTWEDPMVELGGMIAERSMRAEDGDLLYAAEQKLPLFGKPGAMRRVARAEQATETATADLRFQTLRRDLARAAFRTGLSSEVIRLGEQDLAWLETMAATAEGRYRAGQATLTEVLQVQNERARKSTQVQRDRDQLKHDEFALNRFLNRQEDSAWPRFTLPPIAEPVPYNAQIVSFAMRYTPELTMLAKEVSTAEAMVDATRRERYPDMSVGLEGRNYTGNGEFRQGMVALRVNVPWFNRGKYRAAMSRDQQKLEAARKDLENAQLALKEEVHLLTIRIESARREARLYQSDIIPRSESALASARSAWESGSGMFRDVLEARRMLVDARLMQSRAVAEQYEMLSELVLCCGLGDLEALQMLAEGKEPERKKNEK